MAIITEKMRAEIEGLAKRYPSREALMLPLLHLIQEEKACISDKAKEEVAELLRVSLARVHEVVSFYSLYSEQPLGQYRLTVCVNMTCGLMGGESLCKYLSERLEIKPGETTSDGRFTLIRTSECLADCDRPPMMQINERYHSGLNREKVDRLIDELK